jgi:hypothetical protein
MTRRGRFAAAGRIPILAASAVDYRAAPHTGLRKPTACVRSAMDLRRAASPTYLSTEKCAKEIPKQYAYERENLERVGLVRT